MEEPDKDLLFVIQLHPRTAPAMSYRKNDLGLFVELSNTPTSIAIEDIPLKVLIPAFIISELKTSFIMGFAFIPFLLITVFRRS